MQVNLNTQNYAPKFGMAFKVPDAQKTNVQNYLIKHIERIEDTVKLNKFIESQKNNPADIYLLTEGIKNSESEKIKAVIGGREIIGKNPLKVIQKAVGYANKEYNEKMAHEAKYLGLLNVISKLM